MKIAEIYKSMQGEGVLTGTPSVFVRTSGCNLRCWFCDTPFASWRPEGRDYTVDEIVAEIEEWDARHVVLTGGEPMLFAEVLPLTAELRRRRLHITIETAGTLYLPVDCDLMSISPKLPGSGPGERMDARWQRRHERQRHRPEIVARLMQDYEYQLKFVIDEANDIEEVEQYLAQLPEVRNERVLLMPQGIETNELESKEPWINAACVERGWTFCPRRQIEWFGPIRGT